MSPANGDKCRKTVENAQGKEWLYGQMKKIPGLCVYPPCVNFIFWKLTGDGARTADLAEVLKAQGLLIRDCANYPGLSFCGKARFFRSRLAGRGCAAALRLTC